MILISCHAKIGFANSYVLGPEGGGRAALIDPGFFHAGLFERVERAGLVIPDGAADAAPSLPHGRSVHGVAGVPSPGLRRRRRIALRPGRRPGRQDATGWSDRARRLAHLPGHGAPRLRRRRRGLPSGRPAVPGQRADCRRASAPPPRPPPAPPLVAALRARVLTLPDRVTIMPGHGPPTTGQGRARLQRRPQLDTTRPNKRASSHTAE